MKNYSDSKHGRRKGRRVGFPEFKAKPRDRLRFRYTTGAFGVASATAVKLPRIGEVRVHEHTDRLGALIGVGDARILSMSVTFRRDRWHAVIACLVRQGATVNAAQATPTATTRLAGRSKANDRASGQ